MIRKLLNRSHLRRHALGPGLEPPAIFVAHPSEHLTDYLPNGDGLIAHGFLSGLANRGYRLHVATDRLSLQHPMPEGVTLYPLNVKATNRGLHRVEYTLRMRLLYERLRRRHNFALLLQMNPVFPGISLGLIGTGVPLVLGTFVAFWNADLNSRKDEYERSSSSLSGCRDLLVSIQQAHADALLFTTKVAYNRIPRWRKFERKLYQLSHGIDATLFSPASKPLPKEKSQSILFLANVVERKGILVLLDAFQILGGRFPECRLSIAGEGEAMEEVRRRVAASPYQSRIQILGALDRSQTPSVYRDHALYCLPSFGEPYATALLEAMACGLPVVSTNTGGTPELVFPLGSRLVESGDPSALAQALGEVLSSTALTRSMGAENRRYVLERHTWDAVLDQLEAIYFEVTNGVLGRQLSSDDVPSTHRERLHLEPDLK